MKQRELWNEAAQQWLRNNCCGEEMRSVTRTLRRETPELGHQVKITFGPQGQRTFYYPDRLPKGTA